MSSMSNPRDVQIHRLDLQAQLSLVVCYAWCCARMVHRQALAWAKKQMCSL